MITEYHIVVNKVQMIDVGKTFHQMRHHCAQIARLRQNVKQFIITKKEEAWKGHALQLQAVFDTLQDLLEICMANLKHL